MKHSKSLLLFVSLLLLLSVLTACDTKEDTVITFEQISPQQAKQIMDTRKTIF